MTGFYVKCNTGLKWVIYGDYQFTKIYIFVKKRLWHMCFPVNLEKFLRTPPYECFRFMAEN